MSDFSDDGSGAAERRYRSEQRPALGSRRDGLLVLVAASFVELVTGDGMVRARAIRVWQHDQL